MLDVTTQTLRPARTGWEERFALGRRTSLVVAVGVVVHTLWTSAAPAMVYQLYAAQWRRLVIVRYHLRSI